ncbi:hypothetical protein QQF64_025768 [Cirrhinus molitorella]|uniref:Uncharacterized protein n=1 Tax=Cirrhinus molitorella TaxID=172907 RepID=A0ABR3NQE2_9TELE
MVEVLGERDVCGSTPEADRLITERQAERERQRERDRRDETDSAVLCGSVTEAHCQRLLPPALLIMSCSPSPAHIPLSILTNAASCLHIISVSIWKHVNVQLYI